MGECEEFRICQLCGTRPIHFLDQECEGIDAAFLKVGVDSLCLGRCGMALIDVQTLYTVRCSHHLTPFYAGSKGFRVYAPLVLPLSLKTALQPYAESAGTCSTLSELFLSGPRIRHLDIRGCARIKVRTVGDAPGSR